MKNILLAFFAVLLSGQVDAQVKLNLSYQPDTKVYTVSIIPEVTWSAPKNMVASAQIVLKIPANTDFTPGVTSLVDGLVWSDNAYIENPDAMPGAAFVCLALVNGPTSKIEITEGKEIALFSFVNAGGDCVGKLELMQNNDPGIQSMRAEGYNVTQYLALLGAGGNAISGIQHGEVDCSPATGLVDPVEKMVGDVKISPVPADKETNIQWVQFAERSPYQQMVVFDVQGTEMYREKISTAKGPHAVQLLTDNWPAGMYSMRFVSTNGQATKAWNLMVMH